MSLSVIKGVQQQGSTPAASTVTGSIGIGQLMLAMCQGGTLPGSATVSDNVNTGNYSAISYGAANLVIFWKITNASNAGSTSVTLSTPGGYSYITAGAVTGFAGTPTQDTSITNTATGTGTTAAISAASNFNNEILLVNQLTNGYTGNVTVSGWTGLATASPNNQPGFYAIEASSGTANNFSGTFTPSSTWYLQLAGFYDPGVPPSVPSQGPMPRQLYVMP